MVRWHGIVTDLIIQSVVIGGLAQMVERSLSMREVPGSIPGFSTCKAISYIFENQN